VFRSAQHHALPIERGVFTRGRAAWGYLNALGAHLFLSANEDDVRGALAAGFPAARVYPDSARAAGSHPDEVRIAFDGDAVLFSDEAERVFQGEGLVAFQRHEHSNASTPLMPGPPPRQNSCRLHRSTPGAAMKDGRGSIRTGIQGQGGGKAAAAGERGAGGGGARGWHWSGDSGALAR
jgi:5'-nucleotidase